MYACQITNKYSNSLEEYYIKYFYWGLKFFINIISLFK